MIENNENIELNEKNENQNSLHSNIIEQEEKVKTKNSTNYKSDNSKKNLKNKNSKKQIQIPKIKITNEDIINGPICSIEEIYSSSILKKDKLIINPGGLIGGREKKDGVSFFVLPNSSFKYKDYILNLNAKNEKENDFYIFMIYYDVENTKYNIDFNENFSRKISIHLFGQMSIPIKQKEIISFGDIIIELIPNLNNGLIQLINLKEDRKFEFEKKEKIITIGKGNNCKISVESKMNISKIQCTLTFSINDNAWILNDGYEDKNSNNGTWMVASNSYPLYNNMEIDIFSNFLKINIY